MRPLSSAATPCGTFHREASVHLARDPDDRARFQRYRHDFVSRRVGFLSATYGINTGGTVYRADGVAIPLRPALSSPLAERSRDLDQNRPTNPRADGRS